MLRVIPTGGGFKIFALTTDFRFTFVQEFTLTHALMHTHKHTLAHALTLAHTHSGTHSIYFCLETFVGVLSRSKTETSSLDFSF